MKIDNVPDDIVDLLSREFRSWNPEARLIGISALTPDASLRRYFRVTYRGQSEGSTIAMVFDSIACPEATGAVSVNSFDAVIELTKFLTRHGVPVPEIYASRKDPYLVWGEDLGDNLLAQFALRTTSTRISNSELEGLYRSAIDTIVVIQGISPVKGFFPYERVFSPAIYRSEMNEFRDFIFTPLNPKQEELGVLEESFSLITSELDALPKVLVHRDFHSWNLMVDSERRLRVIDFQDALMATRCYDVVALLNDRDTDSAIGNEMYRDLANYFFEKFSNQAELRSEYDRVLLQRDLKVAGRFAKLVQVRGLKSYGAWIPGTLRRIGRTLERLTRDTNSHAQYAKLRQLVERYVPEIRIGAETPISFD